jgi:hypothetical protein
LVANPLARIATRHELNENPAATILASSHSQSHRIVLVAFSGKGRLFYRGWPVDEWVLPSIPSSIDHTSNTSRHQALELLQSQQARNNSLELSYRLVHLRGIP